MVLYLEGGIAYLLIRIRTVERVGHEQFGIDKMRYLKLLFFPMLALLMAGCQHFFEIEDPFITVKESGLNWVEIRQYQLTGRQQRVRVRIDGNGIVSVKEGTSPLVGNPFAADTNHQQWDDIRESRFSIPAAEATLVFQRLVDSGMFVKPEHFQKRKEAVTNDTSMIFVTANIQSKTIGSPDPVTDPDVLEALKMTLLTFYHPRPVRRQ